MSSAASRRLAVGAGAAIVLATAPLPVRAQQAARTGASSGVVPPSAADASPVAPGEAPPPAGALDPDSPLAPMADLGVEWPDLARPDDFALPAAPSPTPPMTSPSPAPAARPGGGRPIPTLSPPPPRVRSATLLSDAGERRYAVRIEGLDPADEADLRLRFDALSSLHAGEGKPANVAQIDRRAREDSQMLSDLLRARGYYDAEVDTRVAAPSGPGAPRLTVTLLVTPGPAYAFTSVRLPGLEKTGADREALAKSFAVGDGDRVDAEAVQASVAALRAALGAHGFAFATVAEPQVTVDHDDRSATLVLAIDPGRVPRRGAIRVTGRRVFGPGHVTRISRLKPGDRYNGARLDDLRRALIATGLVSVAQVTPTRTADPQVVDLVVHLEPAPPRTIAATFGYGTGEGASVEVSWQHRNLFPPEGGLTLRGKLGEQEQLASVQFRRGNFRQRDQVLVAQAAASHLNRPAYDARTLTLAAGIERQTNIIWQKTWTWSYGAELSASDERDVIAATGASRRRTFFVGALPTSLTYDGSDDLLNPSRGYRLSGRVSPELSLQGSAFGYARIQIDGSVYRPVASRVVLAGRVRLGSIQGASRDQIAPTRRGQ
jgi:translocation and assembly module TamA